MATVDDMAVCDGERCLAGWGQRLGFGGRGKRAGEGVLVPFYGARDVGLVSQGGIQAGHGPGLSCDLIARR